MCIRDSTYTEELRESLLRTKAIATRLKNALAVPDDPDLEVCYRPTVLYDAHRYTREMCIRDRLNNEFKAAEEEVTVNNGAFKYEEGYSYRVVISYYAEARTYTPVEEPPTPPYICLLYTSRCV